jgi:membrane-associated phospholipid phosphatase
VQRYAICSLILAVLAIAIAPFDSWITQNFNMTTGTGDIRRIIALSEIFAHGFGVAIVVAMTYCLAPRPIRQKVPRLLSCLLLAGIAVHLVKHLVVRRRPQSYGSRPKVDAKLTWWENIDGSQDVAVWNSEYLMQSFPSGHSATAFCMALSLTVLFPRGRYIFFTLAIMAMLQRIMFLAHWPSDCLFGAAVAVMVAGNVFHAPLSDKAFAWAEKPITDNPDLLHHQST